MPKKPTAASMRARLDKLARDTRPGMPVRDFELTNDILALVDPSGDLVSGPFDLDKLDDAMRLAQVVFGGRARILETASLVARAEAEGDSPRASHGASVALALAVVDAALAEVEGWQ